MIRIFYSFIFVMLLSAAFVVHAQNPQATPPPVQPTDQPRPSQPQPPVTTTDPRPSQAQPQTPPGTTPGGQISNPNTVIQQTPTQGVGATGGVAPAVLPDEPPPVAPNFQAPSRPLPNADRVGVDVANQLPMTLEEAITLALRNNNNIDVSRNNVQIAEYVLRGARGVYDPLFAAEHFYESATTPTASAIGGAVNGAVTQTRYFSSSGVAGFSPFAGGEYVVNFNSSRTSTSSTNAFLNPQFPSALTFTYTQPLFRNFRFDNNRRQIEIAKKTLGLTDAQFRQQAIEVIAQVTSQYSDPVS